MARTHRDGGSGRCSATEDPSGSLVRYADSCMDKPKILTRKELRAIMPRLAGWKLAQNKLSRTFEFQDFVQSLSFVNSLVAYFETIDHHPDVYIAYGEVTFELTRYDVGGKVTDRDVEVAKKISSGARIRPIACSPPSRTQPFGSWHTRAVGSPDRARV